MGSEDPHFLCPSTLPSVPAAQVCIEEEDTRQVQETYHQFKALAQEIRMMENLSHPNIVRYLGTDRTENGIYIFMEYIPGMPQ